jgi:hypothetical protein
MLEYLTLPRKEYAMATPWPRNKPLAKNALPANVVPRRDRAKGNRAERGGHQMARKLK